MLAAALGLLALPAAAQDPPPRIGPFVVDVQGIFPRFPSDDAQLAASRGLLVSELPGRGLGLHTTAQVYLLRWKAVTFGIGGELTMVRARKDSQEISDGVFSRATTEQFTHVAPQLSFNFGDGDGWSYISGGIGPSTWSLGLTGEPATPPDSERLKTINYGGGARWFIKRHLAFSLDVRFYAINPSTALPQYPSSPRTTLLMMGAGISLK